MTSSGSKKQSSTIGGKSGGGGGDASKKQQHHRSSGVNKRGADKNYDHPWLMTTLKGHTDQVYDIDFTSNGKYLATCSEGMFKFFFIIF